MTTSVGSKRFYATGFLFSIIRSLADIISENSVKSRQTSTCARR
jgi:hypothetical protein